MDFGSPVTEIISRVWDCTATRATYLCKLEKNLCSLRTSLNKLKNQRNDVKRNVDDAEANPIEPMKRTDVVDGWLKRVEEFEHEVEAMLEEGSKQIKEGSGLSGCFCCCRPKNCWTGYKLGKLVVEKIEDAENLIRDGPHFDVVVARSRPAVLVHEMPTTQAVGMDTKLDEIWRLVTEQNQVRILGIYGMGGVGKTTLLTNLNNEFVKRNHYFDVVLWVVVSKDLNLKNVQKQIGDEIGLKWGPEDLDLGRRAKDIFKVLRGKKFVLLLDDIWERVDLQSIGIPLPHEGITSKVVFTTRSEVVCGHMEVHKRIRVECLDWDKAWSLFQKKVGEEALKCHPKVPKLAEIVAKECCGLPLALIVIGRTMASKKTPQEWDHAITVLKRSASEFSGMKDEILPILKFSYDDLKSEKIKSCFLYCSVFPEDHSIKKAELIDYWISEGFLDGLDDIDEARNEGYDVIGDLLSSGLLESSGENSWGINSVKMHDVIRDLAIWIASDLGKKKGNFLVQVGNILKLDEWEKAERISCIHLDAGHIVFDAAPDCPNLLTLLFCTNYGLNRISISDEFFLSMPMLRVLNLPRYENRALPTSITSLFKLQHLDLSDTDNLEVVPSEIKNLVTLKYLNLSSTGSLRKIPPGLMACLTKLQYLNLFNSNFGDWEVEGGPSLRELEGLKHLNYLGITINNILALQKLVSSDKLQLCTRELLVWDVRGGLTSIALSPPALPSSSLSIANLKCLRYLWFMKCDELEEVTISWAATAEKGEIPLLTTLERLYFHGVPKLKIVWEKDLLQQSFCFTNLKDVYIEGCHALKDLTWLLYAPGLKVLRVYWSNGIEEIISDDEFAGVVDQTRLLNTFSTLKALRLINLPNLKSICKYCLAFPSLTEIGVSRCPKLKKLPLDINSANNNTLRGIYGEREWWEGLEWEDETIKSTFVPYFKEG